jgi:hypothetical protein
VKGKFHFCYSSGTSFTNYFSKGLFLRLAPGKTKGIGSLQMTPH